MRIVILIFLTTCFISSSKRTTTMRIMDRVRLLKDKIRNSLRNPSQSEPEPIPRYDESDEYSPIQPILEHDALKKDDKFKLKRLKTETTKVVEVLRTVETKPSSVKSVQKPLIHSLLNERVTAISKSLKAPTVSPAKSPALEIFYRKSGGDILETPVEWLHCSEHVTPYLKGVINTLTKPRKTKKEDNIVHRIDNLLTVNISRMSRSEKRSVMFQFSKLKIRLYSWESAAINLVTSKIANHYAKSKIINFESLKRGMMNLLNTMQADLSNLTWLLVESKIFRPPCIYTNEEGSSKFVPGSTLPVPSVRMPDSLECVRRDQNNRCL